MIHSDFERGFIAAEIVAYADLVAAGSHSKAKEAGKSASKARNTSCRTATWWTSGSMCEVGQNGFSEVNLRVVRAYQSQT